MPLENAKPVPASAKNSNNTIADREEESNSRYEKDIEDLIDLLHGNVKIPKQKSGNIITWLENIYKCSRGFELGTLNASVIPIVWKKQSVNWNDLALGYISDVICIVHRFILNLLRSICKDVRVLKGLMSVLMEDLILRYKSSINQVEFVLKVERDGTALTTNHHFSENLKKW